MIKRKIALSTIVILLVMVSQSFALPPIEGKVFGITPLTNEMSFYKNTDDGGADRGHTLQIVAINSLKIWTDFTFEFTADYNFKLNYRFDNAGEIIGKRDKDHYIELSLVKPIYKTISLNYQRIYTTFEDKPINQFGIRLSL